MKYSDASAVLDVTSWIGAAIWVIIGVGIVTRIVIAIVRRRPRDIKRTVLDPIARSGAAQSRAYGWHPQEPDSTETENDGGSPRR